jgi:F-type H+-transporting ATPase subunit b
MRTVHALLPAFLLLCAGSGTAHAAEHPANWSDLLWRCVTIALVAGVLWKFAGKKLHAFFVNRRSGIAQELHDLEARKEAARTQLAEVEQRIGRLDAEREAVLAEFRAKGEALRMEIIAKAEGEAARIKEQARLTAQNETDRALAAVRAEMADHIILAAQDILKTRLSAGEHTKLIDSLLTKVVLQ